MHPSETGPVTRRGFLAGLGALVVAVQLPRPARAAESAVYPSANDAATLNAFVGVGTDGTVTVVCPTAEMGQGSTTGLAQCVADELDAPWDRVRVVHADEGKPYRFALLPFDARHMTGASMSTRTWRTPMREAGARARAMLIQAAAARWGVNPGACTTRQGVVVHPDGHEATYGELATAAAALKPPRKVPLKAPAQFTLMGRSPQREDLLGKVTGATPYGIDLRLPDMVRACTVSCPVHGGVVASVDDQAARAVPGVLDVLVFEDFVAVLAETWWPAKRAADALVITWDDRGFGEVDSALISAELRAALDDDKGATTARKEGDALKVLASAAQVIEAEYEVPYLEHAAMEPLNCTVHLQPDRCDVWTGTQGQTRALWAAQEITGLSEAQIHVHTAYLGGGYGRRGNVDWVRHALRIATRVDRPVQMLWSREETTRIGRYRPVEVARLRAAVGDGRITALHARIAGDHSARSYLSGFITKLPLYRTLLAEGMLPADSPYAFPSVRVDTVLRTFHVNVGFWRSVGQSYTAFFRECFLDEVAHALGQDPVALRRSLLREDRPRIRAVLDRVVEASGWGKAPEGHFQGIGLTDWSGSYCAQVVEITVEDDAPRVRRLTAVVDCGVVVNPDQVKAQIMGGALFGLSSALGEAITLRGGRVEQSNLHDYRLLRMNQSPVEVEVLLMDRPDDPPMGVGEAGTPPAIPALCNALFAATGRRVRRLPIPRKLSEIEG
ncbi:MAG: xanthine dehydrogenase family protein molybdopterin-binding subunit [Alphaproteobacteria bacterium]|nr:xanthine dehydrogenase family protein molybdopterin-binding subunit [Alphaproteobacteria bacterium]